MKFLRMISKVGDNSSIYKYIDSVILDFRSLACYFS